MIGHDAPPPSAQDKDKLADDFDIDAPPTDAERLAAEALALALEAGDSTSGGDESFVAALRHAHSPSPIAEERLAAIVEAALDTALPRRRGRVFRVAFGGGMAALAMAAAAALFLQFGVRPESGTTAATAPELTAPRSAQELFDEPFPRTGGTSERVDRIVSARERELRANRYAAWGVR